MFIHKKYFSGDVTMKKSVKLVSILLVFILSFSVIQTSFIASAADSGIAYCETYEIENRQAAAASTEANTDEAATPGEATPPAAEKSEIAQKIEEFFSHEFFVFLKSFIDFLVDFIFTLIG